MDVPSVEREESAVRTDPEPVCADPDDAPMDGAGNKHEHERVTPMK